MTNNYVRFWGVRGSYPAPFATHMGYGGNTPCVEVRLGEHLIVLDAGTGIIPLGNQLMAQQDIRHLQMITGKPVMYIANVDEGGFENNPHLDAVREYAEAEGAHRRVRTADDESD